MTDIKIGDVVVLNTSRPNSMNDLRIISSLYENGKCAVTTDGRKIRLLCGDFKVHIHATPEEIAAGNRIDEPVNNPDSSCKEVEKEAVSANMDEFEGFYPKHFLETAEFSESKNSYVVAAGKADNEINGMVVYQMNFGWTLWQHQQAMVDEKQDEINYLKAERNREQEAAWSTHDEQVGIIQQQDDKIKELQKRVDAVRALVDDWDMKEMPIKTEYSRGKLHGLYDCVKELKKALGADHEAP